jgi:hypothetical protein
MKKTSSLLRVLASAPPLWPQSMFRISPSHINSAVPLVPRANDLFPRHEPHAVTMLNRQVNGTPTTRANHLVDKRISNQGTSWGLLQRLSILAVFCKSDSIFYVIRISLGRDIAGDRPRHVATQNTKNCAHSSLDSLARANSAPSMSILITADVI